MSMQIPRDIYDTWKAVADKFKFLHQGTDDERREATKRGVQTIRARHGEEGKRWSAKSQHNTGWSAQSKDALAYIPSGLVVTGRNAQMDMFDMINGSSRETNPYPVVSNNHEEGNHTAYILVPDDFDWLEDGTTPVPKPDSTHMYDGGGNDTGTCDICGQDRFADVHKIPAASQPHAYNGGEQDTGLCDVCQKPRTDALHNGGTTPVPPDSDLETRVAALEQRVTKLENAVEILANKMVSEEKVTEIVAEELKKYEVFTENQPAGISYLRHNHGVTSVLRKKA